MKLKKLTFITLSVALTMLILAGSSQAQKKYVNKALSWAEKGENLDTALVLLNLALEDEKTKDWAKTYYAKGILFKSINKTENAQFKTLSDYPLIDAMDNFVKAYDSNGAGAIKTLIDVAILDLPNEIANSAVNFYNEENFKAAFLYFQKIYEIKQLPLFGEEIDTASVFNTALMAQRAKDYDNAIKYYTISLEYEYGEGGTYALLAEIYNQKEDTDNYLKILKEGFEKYPDDQSLLGSLINYYLIDSENPKDAIEYLDFAISKQPGNANLYSGRAMLYDKLGDFESCKVNYKKAIEIDGEFFEAFYNLGVLYFNEGVELTDVANEIKDNEKYAIAKQIADDKFKESLPYLEKAFELNEEDISIGNTLRTLYYRLQMTDKYEALNKKLD
ncbi:MAG: tetratricopeptide repeat protein [Bacteroidales bacterium]|nr:tetratricopeptide repeat protein [Bacteroidales bacterium]